MKNITLFQEQSEISKADENRVYQQKAKEIMADFGHENPDPPLLDEVASVLEYADKQLMQQTQFQR